MVRRIAALVFIFACTSFAWMVLGATIFSRTYERKHDLHGRVASTWGSSQRQQPPEATYEYLVTRDQVSVEDGKKVVRKVEERHSASLPLESSRVDVQLNLEHRQKGLLWYSTYRVGFDGYYRFRNSSGQEQRVRFELPYPAKQAIYDDLQFTVDEQPLEPVTTAEGVRVEAPVAAGRGVMLRVRYRSQGLDEWGYDFGDGVSQVRDFQLRAVTDFKAIDFADNTLSPAEKRETQGGWELLWTYKNLVSGYDISVVMPEKLQPGPLAGRISFFAPVSLFFFFFLMFIITTLRGIELHPMNYFFLAAAFFAFHLLMAYLADHISIHAAFAASAVVSVFLVVSYLRLVVGLRFAAREAGLAQAVYLVLFSYAFFFEGYTGLAVTIGSIVTLFVVMQMTGRIRWEEKFSGKPAEVKA